MKRRAFIAALGGAAAWPGAAWGQQPTTPVVGFVTMRDDDYEPFALGLRETGYVDHRNVLIDYRKADSSDQLPAIGVDLVRNNVAAICGLPNAIIAAKAVTSTIPMVFVGGVDPVARGLVASFNRPGGNVTGLRLIAGELPSKQIELLHELVPGAIKVGLLLSPQFSDAES